MDICSAEKLLSDNKLKVTKKRLAVLELLLNTAGPVSINEIFNKLNKEINIDMATVYRVINRFMENHIVREVSSGNNVSLYEKACIHNPIHPHFICAACGQVYCLKKSNLEFENSLLQQTLDLPEVNVINEVDIELKGICSNCI